MVALTADRGTEEREGQLFGFPMAAGSTAYAGALIVLNAAGFAQPGTAAQGLVVAGRSEEFKDNAAGANGDITLIVREGTFKFANDVGDAIGMPAVGDTCYVSDDQTVSRTSGGGAKSAAGYVRDVDADGVWVELRTTASADGDLVAANNLADVANATTSRGNIGADQLAIVMNINLANGTHCLASPVAGTVTGIRSATNAAPDVGDATLTPNIGGVNITNGAITIAIAGGGTGITDTQGGVLAANTLAVGDSLRVVVTGGNGAAVTGSVTFLIRTNV